MFENVVKIGGFQEVWPRLWTHYTWVKKPFVKTFSSEVLPVRNQQFSEGSDEDTWT